MTGQGRPPSPLAQECRTLVATLPVTAAVDLFAGALAGTTPSPRARAAGRHEALDFGSHPMARRRLRLRGASQRPR
jgi:hypothetical protein